MVHGDLISIQTKGQSDIQNITAQVQRIVTASGVKEGAVRAQEYYDPENSGHAVQKVCSRCGPSSCGAAEACEKNGGSQRNHNAIREVIGEFPDARIFSLWPRAFFVQLIVRWFDIH